MNFKVPAYFNIFKRVDRSFSHKPPQLSKQNNAFYPSTKNRVTRIMLSRQCHSKQEVIVTPPPLEIKLLCAWSNFPSKHTVIKYTFTNMKKKSYLDIRCQRRRCRLVHRRESRRIKSALVSVASIADSRSRHHCHRVESGEHHALRLLTTDRILHEAQKIFESILKVCRKCQSTVEEFRITK